MCKKKNDVLVANPEPKSRTLMTSSISAGSMPPLSPEWSSESAANAAREAARFSSFKPSSSSSSDRLSIAGIRDFLPETPNAYEFSEIFSATRSPQARRLSSPSSNSWRCSVRGKDVAVFQRRFLGDPSDFRRRVAAASGAHHKNIVRLLGAALGGADIFLVYEIVAGASLKECLRNPRNPEFTPLASWLDRMQIAADIAQGLQYIHHFTAGGAAAPPPSKSNGGRRFPVHDRIKSSSIMITEAGRRAKIGHFSAVELSRGTCESDDSDGGKAELRRSGSGKAKLEGARGYIAPEIRHGGSPSQKSDVYAFGVVLLELLTGEEPTKYTYNSEIKRYEVISLTESAINLTDSLHRLRSWMDRRLKDSFPEEVAERAVRVAVDCVNPQAEKRPTMVHVAAKLSALLMQSKKWAEKMNIREEITVSLAPR